MSAAPVVVQSGDGKVYQFPGEPDAKMFEASAQAAGGETLRLVPATPPMARTLYDLESHLAALLDTEEVVPEDLEREYALELHATLVGTAAKRDRVGQFLQHLKSQIAFAHTEVSRLQQREVRYTAALNRLQGYVTTVIESLGKDSKGARKKLEGTTLTLSLHGCVQRVDLPDEEAVPSKYKRATVTLPAELWEQVCDSLDFELRAEVLGALKSPKLEVSLSLAKEALDAGVEVPGARLAGGTYVVCK